VQPVSGITACQFSAHSEGWLCVRCGRLVRAKLASPPVAACGQRRKAPEPHGPGTELKKLLKRVGITATPNCSCNARARRMDEEEVREPGWCEAHLDEIVGWLREEATKRGLPFVDMAGRVLVKRAISNARKAEARRAKEAQPAESGPA
jgi:hypothetical protein